MDANKRDRLIYKLALVILVIYVIIFLFTLNSEAIAQIVAMKMYPGEVLTVICDARHLTVEVVDDLTLTLECSNQMIQTYIPLITR